MSFSSLRQLVLPLLLPVAATIGTVFAAIVVVANSSPPDRGVILGTMVLPLVTAALWVAYLQKQHRLRSEPVELNAALATLSTLAHRFLTGGVHGPSIVFTFDHPEVGTFRVHITPQSPQRFGDAPLSPSTWPRGFNPKLESEWVPRRGHTRYLLKSVDPIKNVALLVDAEAPRLPPLAVSGFRLLEGFTCSRIPDDDVQA